MILKFLKKAIIKIRSRILSINQVIGNVSVGKKTIVNECVINGDVSIGNNSKIIRCTIKGNVSIGRFTSIVGPNTFLYSQVNNIIIGNFCSIARNVSVQENNHNADNITTYYMGKNFFKESWKSDHNSKGDIVIGNDVWIGSGAMILSGVNIGDGAIIGANAVVTNAVPAYAIVAGTPAKVIKYRFSPEIITRLLDLKWWDWSDDKIKENKTLFMQSLTLDRLNDQID